MTDAIHRSASSAPSYRGAALSGLLVAESARDISLEVDGGTWTFDRADVLRVIPERHQRPDSRAVQAVRVDIRPGATADFTQRRRVDLVDRPITLAAEPSEAVGDDQLTTATRRWAARKGIAERRGNGATFTFAQTKSHNGSDDGINCDSLD
ncbi:hypothetical protein [Nocardia camponoti]|uniref:Uncharacterized protein n=1 Tax=Nocardia camponoti TaxID=1616106 RepID=A0A917V519_9NOCA|nr:hypothetical protein [Nocardia camponoti]GGK38719.1 hypothetical protein GCM10011591_08060 [Nocardia camponoti]